MKNCLCWGCCRLGSCRSANGEIKKCEDFEKYNYKQFVRHCEPVEDIASNVGVSLRTVYRWLNTLDVDTIINKFKKRKAKVKIIIKNGKKIIEDIEYE